MNARRASSEPATSSAPAAGTSGHGLAGMAWLLAFQTLGELLSRGLPLPGPVAGLVLLLLSLRWAPVRQAVASAAEFLLSHLSLLFVPVAVGVMSYLPLLSAYGLRLAVVIVVSTWAGLLVSAAVLYRLTPEARENA